MRNVIRAVTLLTLYLIIGPTDAYADQLAQLNRAFHLDVDHRARSAILDDAIREAANNPLLCLELARRFDLPSPRDLLGLFVTGRHPCAASLFDVIESMRLTGFVPPALYRPATNDEWVGQRATVKRFARGDKENAVFLFMELNRRRITRDFREAISMFVIDQPWGDHEEIKVYGESMSWQKFIIEFTSGERGENLNTNAVRKITGSLKRKLNLGDATEAIDLLETVRAWANAEASD